MERMTTKRPDGRWAIANCDNASPMEQTMKIPMAIARLAAYEDTGLAPKEIMSQEKWAVDLGKKMAAESIAEIEKQCKEIYGVSSNRLFEILRAEADGRLIILEKDDNPMSLDALALFLRNRADMAGELNEYDKMLMREASDRLAEVTLKGEAK